MQVKERAGQTYRDIREHLQHPISEDCYPADAYKPAKVWMDTVNVYGLVMVDGGWIHMVSDPQCGPPHGGPIADAIQRGAKVPMDAPCQFRTIPSRRIDSIVWMFPEVDWLDEECARG